jgi:two-component system, NarL family, sensor histidine kinase DesK
MSDATCAGSARIARPGPWLLCALVWLGVLMIAPVADLAGRHDLVLPVLALLLLVAGTAGAVLGNTFAPAAPPWAVPASLGVLSFLAVATTIGYGQPWWNIWVVLAATAAGATRGRAGLVVAAAVPASASLVLWGTGASGAQVWVLALTAFLAGAANHVLVRLLQTIGELRVAQGELADRAVLEERERFSRDLHDLLGHTLSVVVVKAEAVRRLSHRDPEAAMRHTLDIETIGREALAEVRQAVDGYRRTTLAAEIAGAQVALEAAGIEAQLDPPETTLPPDVDEAFAWVVREGVTNVIRHSRARSCRLDIGTAPGAVRLELTDDGPGAQGDEARPGAGLEGLRQRLTTTRGDLVATRSVEGFRLVVTVPVGGAGALPVTPSSVTEQG